MQLANMDLTMECIGSTSLVRVMKVGHGTLCCLSECRSLCAACVITYEQIGNIATF